MSLEPTLLTDIIGECAARAGVVGAQVSVVGPGGRADVTWGQSDSGRDMAVDERMQVGSLAKVLTAVLVHQLVDDGLVSLRDEVPGVTGVAVGQLLSMTSGLDWGLWAAGDTVAEALLPQLALPRRAAPGSFGYSFAGTMVAARLVERLRGGSWWQSVCERIARPLGVAFSETGTLTGMAPTGTTLCASAADLATLAVAVADPDGPLLSRSSHAALHEPVVDVGALMCADAWCHGPYSRSAGKSVLHGHGGRWAGGVSDLTWQAATGTAVAIVTNTPERGGELVREVSRAVHPLLWGEAAFVPTAPVASSLQDLDTLTGLYSTATRVYDVQRQDDRLVVHATSRPNDAAVFMLPDARVELVAVGRRRFLPSHETREERRLQEFWFSGEPTPEHCYDGFVAARREPGGHP